MGLSNVFLIVLDYTLAAIGALLVVDPASLLFHVIVLVLHLDGDRDTWRRMIGLMVDIGCYLRSRCSCLHVVVGLIEVVGFVVV